MKPTPMPPYSLAWWQFCLRFSPSVKFWSMPKLHTAVYRYGIGLWNTVPQGWQFAAKMWPAPSGTYCWSAAVLAWCNWRRLTTKCRAHYGGDSHVQKLCALAVVWNPWQKALSMADLGEGYTNMLCVEAGYVAEPVHLPPGEQFVGTQLLTVISQ